jgi:hypothetical protein
MKRINLILFIIFVLILLVYIFNIYTHNSEGKGPSPYGPEKNLAMNRKREGYPHPLDSDKGWSGGQDAWEIVDGSRNYKDWHHGLAFTGGIDQYVEEAGWRQATIDFGEPTTFSRIVLWHHNGNEHIPKTYKLEYFEEESNDWIKIFSTQEGYSYRVFPIKSSNKWWFGWSTPTENSFEKVTSQKIRYSFDNSDIVHGWLYEFEVYND